LYTAASSPSTLRSFNMSWSTKRSLVAWTIAFSASNALAHPLFNGRLVTRADELLKEYDYVVVGGGASGLTVANRLSEHPGKQVMIVRATQYLTENSYDRSCHRGWPIVSFARTLRL
jgi:adenine/guanine phosphoribosyltransferase-like PRPP-binding protein